MPNVDNKRGPTSFMLASDDERLVIVMDENHPLYDERVKLPIDEDLAVSLANGGQMKPIITRKNGELFEIVDGRQEVKAARWANVRILDGSDPRFSFREKQTINLNITCRRFEDSADLVETMLLSNTSIADTPGIRAKRIWHASKYLSHTAIAKALGLKNASYIEEILRIKDMDPEVQDKVDKGVMPETLAREMVTRSGGRALTFDEQKEVVATIEKHGAKGTKAKNIIRAKKQGRKVGKFLDTKKMRSRDYIERFYEQISGSTPPALAVKAFIDHMLRRKSDIRDFPPLRKIVDLLDYVQPKKGKEWPTTTSTSRR